MGLKSGKLKCEKCGEYAVRVTGREIYPHRPDLKRLKFYQCEPCNSYVGVHKGTNKPLGTLADSELRRHRSKAHKAFDPIWKEDGIKRTVAYSELSKFMGIPVKNTHIAMFDHKQCEQVVKFALLRLSSGRSKWT